MNKSKITRAVSIRQKELWFIHMLGGDAACAYNEPLVYQLNKSLNIDILRKCLIEIHRIQPALRTAFVQDKKGIVSRTIDEEVKIDLEQVFVDSKSQAKSIINAHISKTFDLTMAPLMRVLVVNDNESGNHYLVFNTHHIISDGTSFGALIKKLNQLYDSFSNNKEIESESVLDFEKQVDYETKLFETDLYKKNVIDFSKKLTNYSALNFLTTPSGHSVIDRFSGDRVLFEINQEKLSLLNILAKKNKVTLFHLLFASYAWLLSQYTRSNDIVIGVPFANRQNDANQEIFDYFVNTLPVRIKPKGDIVFSDYLRAVKKTLFDTLCNQQVIFEHINKHLSTEIGPIGQHPMIQTLFAWGSLDKLKLNLDNISATIDKSFYSQTSKFDISLFLLEEKGEGLSGYFEYRTHFFEKEVVQNFRNLFYHLIDNLCQKSIQYLSDLTLLNDKAYQSMKETLFNLPVVRDDRKTLVDIFNDTVTKFPNNIAVIFDGVQTTYQELDKRSNELAKCIIHYQKNRGFSEHNPLIAICVERTLDMLIGVLAILKSGGAYVPVDPQYPKERMDYILSHSKAPLLLTHHCHDDLGLDYPDSQKIYLDESINYTLNNNFELKTIEPKIDDVAYVLYTSGSTGKPKGVSVTHSNVDSLLYSLDAEFDLNERDIWSLYHTYCFDISVWEIWGAFAFGGALLVIPYQVTRNPSLFYEIVKSQKVSVLTQTASAFQMFINEDLKNKDKLTHLKYVGFVGESLKVSILRPWVEKYGVNQPELANLYGITETTVYTNYKFVGLADIEKGRDNIGWPLKEFSMCVLNDNKTWSPVGIVGEICIGGKGLSKGYLYRDELTNERFIKDPYADFLGLDSNALLYKTGDLGRWLPDGSIEYLGRKDFQVKLRGFRIELGEIESVIGSFKGVSHTTVLLKGNGDSAYLSAYFTTKNNALINRDALKAHVASYLPEYMVPSRFSQLEAFPMTVNGKVDRVALANVSESFITSTEIKPLKTPLQQQIGLIWQTLLNIDLSNFSANTSFFEAGGNSLLVIRLLSEIQTVFNVTITLSQFLLSPTIEYLASQVGCDEVSNDMKKLFLEALQSDSILDSSILPLAKDNKNIYQPKSVLLTGANGFLGAYILNELLKNSSVEKIYCLIRAKNEEDAFVKIQIACEQYGLAFDETKIEIIIGDIALSNLGMSLENKALLSQSVDAIYHVAAWVNHVYDYQTLKNANVESIRSLIELCVTDKNKAFHFISTLAAGSISPLDVLSNKEPLSADVESVTNGYLTSKWVAERLVFEAYKRGVPAFIYRPGNIIASTINPVYAKPASNHTLMRLKGILQMQKVYVSANETLEMMPVNLLARAIVDLSLNPQRCDYNLHNKDSISWKYYLSFLCNYGFTLCPVSKETWNQLLKALTPDNAFYPIARYYIQSNDELSKTPEIKPTLFIDCPSYDDLLKQQIETLIKVGFLDNKRKTLEVN